MLGVSRRLFATFVAAATILVLTTGAVSAADPDSSKGARLTLGAKSHISRDAGPARLRLDHGGGLQPPATDVEAGALAVPAPVSGAGFALATWVMVFVAGVLASLRYIARRSRL